MTQIYNIKNKFMYEVLEDYKDATKEIEREEIFNSFCQSVWGCDNKRKVYKKDIKFNIRKDLIGTEIGKIFEAWSIVEFYSYRQMTKDKDYLSLIRQKINNIYTNLFDKKVCLKKEYMNLIKTPKKLYYEWKDGLCDYSAQAITDIIDESIAKSLDVKEKYSKEKMTLSWVDYKKVVEKYFKRMFDNFIPLDDFEDKTKLIIHIDTWNEDNFCIKYFCNGLNGYFKNYQKEYYGLERNKKYKRCEKCRGLFEVEYPNQKLCVSCSTYQPIGTKTIKCIDCGCDVEIDAKDNETCRCEKHRDEHMGELKKKQNKRAYEKRKSK